MTGSGLLARRLLRWLLIAALTLALASPALARRKPVRRPRPAAPPPAATSAPAAPPPTAPTAPTAPARPADDRSRPAGTGVTIEGAAPVGAGPYGRRVEFDALTILGQTKAAGAVYLFERQHSDLHSMVERRRSYRDELRRELHERRP